MADFDLTDGGRRRIVSADQERNLRERAESLDELYRAIEEGRGTACYWPEIAARIERDETMWDELGEESQDPGEG